MTLSASESINEYETIATTATSFQNYHIYVLLKDLRLYIWEHEIRQTLPFHFPMAQIIIESTNYFVRMIFLLDRLIIIQ